MARRRSARHARPTGRGALAAAYAALDADVARLRSAGFADQLELVRLAAVVDGLVGQVQRLSLELAALRQELGAARSAPVQPDPLVELLSTQVSELRSTVATQQAMLSELDRRVLALLTRLDQPAVVAPGPVAPPPAVPTAPPAYPLAGDRPEVAARPRGHEPAADDALDDETVLRLRMIRESYGR
jgi:hypothetical protein